MPGRPSSARPAPRHDRDAGGPPYVLAAKAALREYVWAAMRAERVARFPGAEGRIPNFAGAEAAAERLRAMPQWRAARTLKANPDSAQLPVRQRALEDGKTVYMAVPRLAKGGGFADLEFALASAAGLIGPQTVCVTTVHEIQIQPAGEIPLTAHDVPVDFVITPERVIDCRDRQRARPSVGVDWDDLTEEKIAAIPLLTALRQQR
jgi:5-formyltetrahydrofolate cyclo-ligase